MFRPKQNKQPVATVGDTEPNICQYELMQIITQGMYPNEQRLEYLLDRLKGKT